MAGKAVGFGEAFRGEFDGYARRVIDAADALAAGRGGREAGARRWLWLRRALRTAGGRWRRRRRRRRQQGDAPAGPRASRCSGRWDDDAATNGSEESGSLRFTRADLDETLPFEDGEFDVVLCQLVLSHVPDLDPLFAAFQRVLDDGGWFVVATHHPLHDVWIGERETYPWVEVGSTMELDPVVEADPSPPVYHEDGLIHVQWSEGGLTGSYHRRPMETLVTALLRAGFALDGIREPVPDAEFRERWPDAYREFVTRPPEVLCLRGRV